jgi:MATE family multidrug resistance protein
MTDPRTAKPADSENSWKTELGPTLSLAAPVVLAELGWVSMGVIDLLMVGHLGPAAIGAVGIGNIVFFSILVFGLGLFLGLDTLVSHAFGAGDLPECHRWLVQGVYLALSLSAPLMLLVLGTLPLLGSIGLADDVFGEVGPYLNALNWSTLPLLIHVAFRRYLQAMSLVRPVMVALLVANGLKVLGNAALVHGMFGFPRLGVLGAGWSSVAARSVMAGILVGYALWHSARFQTGLLQVSLRLDVRQWRSLLGLGLPAAAQVTLEVGVFGVAALLAGRLGEIALAAHEVVLNITCVAFMVPLGISSAASVRVGQAMGRNDRSGAIRAGWVAIGVGVGFMGLCSLVLLTVPRTLLGLFTDSSAVIATALPLLGAAACSQLFDGLQVVATGSLRGLGDTTTSMVANLAGHWFLGLPIGYTLAFPFGLGVTGLWLGLVSGLISCGVLQLVAWTRTSTRLRRADREAPRVAPQPVCA